MTWNSQAQAAQRSLRQHILSGGVLGLALVGGVGVWAHTTDIAGAVVASGSLVVESSVKKVQHQTGGTIRNLLVRDGSLVEANDVVIRLDDTQARASLNIITQSLEELTARRARLLAEQRGLTTLDRRVLDPKDMAPLVGDERKLFETRRAAREGQKAQLRERSAQLKQEIVGLAGQAVSKQQELVLINNELKGVRELYRKNLVPITRVTSLERDATRIDGERNAIISSVAQTKGKIAETELQIIQIDQDLQKEVSTDMRDVQAKIMELQEKKIAAEDVLQKIEIRAPQRGRVHQLSVHTIGGVVAPGETLMMIVPEYDLLTVEAKIPPKDIDQVHRGQRAIMRFSAFNQRTTPELNGEVSLVSADVTADQRTGTNFYTVRVSIPDDEIARLKDNKLVPGMPVESFIQTGERSVISYLTKPLMDQIMRTFREK
jgi:HlyD family secretion protein